MTPNRTIALPVKGWRTEPTMVAIKTASSIQVSRVTPSGRGITAISTPQPTTTSHFNALLCIQRCRRTHVSQVLRQETRGPKDLHCRFMHIREVPPRDPDPDQKVEPG